jgi:hypothetical protein
MIPSTVWTIVTRLIQRNPAIKARVSAYYKLETIPKEQQHLPARIMATTYDHVRDIRALLQQQYNGDAAKMSSLPWYTRIYQSWQHNRLLQKRANVAVMDGRNNVPLSANAALFASNDTATTTSSNDTGITYGSISDDGSGTAAAPKTVYTSVVARDIAQTLTGVPQQLAPAGPPTNANANANAAMKDVKPTVEVAHVNRRKQKKK